MKRILHFIKSPLPKIPDRKFEGVTDKRKFLHSFKVPLSIKAWSASKDYLFKMKMAKVPSTREIVWKPKPTSPDFRAFLEEIDAPQWVDLDSERNSDCQERDDSWSDTVHSFHQKSFHELVSASPLALQTKGKVRKLVLFNTGLVNSVSKTRGSKQLPRGKLAGIPIDLAGMDKPHNCHTRIEKGKSMPFKSNGHIKTGRSASLQRLSDNTTTTSRSQIPISAYGGEYT